MKTVLTCAQPSGTLTLGNYLGAVRNWAALLPGNECYFGIVDQHAITVDYTPAELRQNSLRCVAQYIACGLDPEAAHIFLQSHVTGHTELAWVLGCLTPVGDLDLRSGKLALGDIAIDKCRHSSKALGIESGDSHVISSNEYASAQSIAHRLSCRCQTRGSATTRAARHRAPARGLLPAAPGTDSRPRPPATSGRRTRTTRRLVSARRTRTQVEVSTSRSRLLSSTQGTRQ